MNCPNCSGYQLTPFELEPGMVSARCAKCQGDLLSLLNYQFWRTQHTTTELKTGDLDCSDNSQAKQCPKCSRLMARYKFSNQSHNRLDYCAPCSETWIDQGEWPLLKSLGLELKLAEIFSDKWQRQLSDQRINQAQDQRFEKILGKTAFNKSNDFKAWLKQQDSHREILRYLQL